MASIEEVAGKVSGLLGELRGRVELVDGTPVFRGGAEELLERLRRVVALEFAGDRLGEAREWIRLFKRETERSSRLLGARGWVLPKELRSFMQDPLHHLMKKLFQYSIDLARGKMGLREYLEKARSAVNTSLATNMRSIYQYWVYAGLIGALAEHGAYPVYPEHGYLHIERTGWQRGGGIPANLILRIPGLGEASFYLEAPRPIGWGDTRDLRRAWRLYTSLRPDLIVYSGRVPDMVVRREDGSLDIRRPDLIIECKELSDWYERTRYLKGPIVKPLTAEEWYTRWFEGLREGLADILGVKPGRAQALKEEKAVKLRDYQLVQLYRHYYKPRKMILVSRARVPGQIREDLESSGIKVIDEVQIGDTRGLNRLAQETLEFFQPTEATDPLEEIIGILRRTGINPDRAKLAKAIVKLAEEHVDELIEIINSND